MKRSQIAASLVLAGVGIFVVQQSRLLTYRDEFGPGPGMLPLWLGGLLVLLAVGQAFAELVRGRGLKPEMGDREEIRADSFGRRHQFSARNSSLSPISRVLFVSVGLAITVAVLDVLGFFLSFLLLSFFLVYVIERQSLPRSIVVAVTITLAFLLVFRVMLPVQLPVNAWGF